MKADVQDEFQFPFLGYVVVTVKPQPLLVHGCVLHAQYFIHWKPATPLHPASVSVVLSNGSPRHDKMLKPPKMCYKVLAGVIPFIWGLGKSKVLLSSWRQRRKHPDPRVVRPSLTKVYLAQGR